MLATDVIEEVGAAFADLFEGPGQPQGVGPEGAQGRGE